MMWGCMMWEGAGMAWQINGIMDGDLYIKILDDELGKSLEYYGKQLKTLSSSKTTTPNTPVRRSRNG
jgi:hypothetical protein